MNPAFRVVLGSRSPQRLALLKQIVPAEQIVVCPPPSAEERGFAGLSSWNEITPRLTEILFTKSRGVRAQCQAWKDDPQQAVILTADTIIVATDKIQPPFSEPRLVVLGQPPEPDWQETVRDWFENLLLGQPHFAVTMVCLVSSARVLVRMVDTKVTFRADAGRWLDWYLQTEEPRGKAGGYGLQGAGSVFVSHVQGSLSNVIGLPLEAVLEMFEELGLPLS